MRFLLLGLLFIGCAHGRFAPCDKPLPDVCAGPPASGDWSARAPWKADGFYSNRSEQQTEALAQARRLIVQERWSEAVPLLREAVRGEFGDKDAQRQLAQAELGVVLVKLGLWNDALPMFTDLGSKPTADLEARTLAYEWLARAATGECPAQSVFEVLATQSPVLWERHAFKSELDWARARGAALAGDSGAREQFQALVTDSKVGDAARACSDVLALEPGVRR